MTKSCQIIALFFLCFIAMPVQALELRFPVACTIMTNCWITDHVDLKGTSDKYEDYMCGQKVTNNNKSTHISLGNLSAATLNVPVMAAADGTVTYAGATGRKCGNLIKIEHDKGWETTYCHLKDQQIFVRNGQEVKQGQIIGVLGMSGQSQWPHLSFGVMQNGLVFDPFSGRSFLDGCSGSTNSKSMWIGGQNPPYEPAHVTNIGFTYRPIQNHHILNGLKTVEAIPFQAQSMALWGLLMNVMEGDEIVTRIYGPNGRVVKENTLSMPFDKDIFPMLMSISRDNLLWDDGIYVGEITIERNVQGNKIKTGKVIRTIIQDPLRIE